MRSSHMRHDRLSEAFPYGQRFHIFKDGDGRSCSAKRMWKTLLRGPSHRPARPVCGPTWCESCICILILYHHNVKFPTTLIDPKLLFCLTCSSEPPALLQRMVMWAHMSMTSSKAQPSRKSQNSTKSNWGKPLPHHQSYHGGGRGLRIPVTTLVAPGATQFATQPTQLSGNTTTGPLALIMFNELLHSTDGFDTRLQIPIIRSMALALSVEASQLARKKPRRSLNEIAEKTLVHHCRL